MGTMDCLFYNCNFCRTSFNLTKTIRSSKLTVLASLLGPIPALPNERRPLNVIVLSSVER